MAYDATKPLDDGYLAEAPAELREQHRALKEDHIVDAGMLNGYTQGNASGNIPLNNGTLNTNLNADMLDGHDSAYFSASTHGHDTATADAAGFMSATDKTKLNGIATGAEVNQNAFGNIKVGSSTIQADGKTDTLTLAAGNAITLTADTTNDKVTIAVTSSTYLPLTGGTLSGDLNTKKITLVDSALYAKTTYNNDSGTTYNSAILRTGTTNSQYGQHVALGGGSGTIVGGGESCTAQLNDLVGADSEQVFIVADNAVHIKTNGNTWANAKDFVFDTSGNLSVPGTVSANGTVLTNYTHPTSAGNKHIPSGGSSGQSLVYSSSGTAQWGYPPKIATQSGTSSGARHVFFAYLGDDNQVVYNDNFMYNPGTDSLTVGKINGYTIAKSVPSDAKFTDTVYTHPTSAGNKHIPSGGSSGQFLKWSASGTAVWAADNDTTYSAGHGLALSSSTFRLAIPVCSCSTAAGTAAKVASVSSGTFALNAGAMAFVKMTNSNTNTSGCTLNIGSTGAKDVYGGNLSNNCLVLYDGARYYVIARVGSTKSKYSASCTDYCSDSD